MKCVLLALLLSIPAIAQNVPGREPVSMLVEQNLRGKLETQGRVLRRRLMRLEEKAALNRSYCSGYGANSARAAECKRRSAGFSVEVREYANSVTAYNAEVLAANREALAWFTRVAAETGIGAEEVSGGSDAEFFLDGEKLDFDRSGTLLLKRVKTKNEPISFSIGEILRVKIEPHSDVELTAQTEDVGQLESTIRALMLKIVEKGRVIFEKLPERKRPFTIKTPRAVTSVRGTSFAIELAPNGYRWKVLSGEIEVADPLSGKVSVPERGKDFQLEAGPGPVSQITP